MKTCISSNNLRPSNTKYSVSVCQNLILEKKSCKVMILAAPCNKSGPSNLSVKSVLNNRQIKKIGGIFYCETKLNFKTVSWLPFLSILTVEKRNKCKVNSRNFASD